MPVPRGLWPLCAAVVLLPLPAAAEIVPFSQSRSVFATCNFGGTQSVSAPDFGPFDQPVSVSGFSQMSLAVSSAGATQLSTIAAAVVHGHGTARAGADTFGLSTFATGEGRSLFSLTFDVIQPTSARIDALVHQNRPDVSGMETIDPSAALRLVGPGGVEFFSVATGVGQLDVHLVATTVLNPGRYTLTASATALASTFVAPNPALDPSASFEFEFLVPAPGAWAALGLLAACTARRRRAS